MSIPVRFTVQRRRTDESVLAPIRRRALEMASWASENENAQARQLVDDLDHLLCAVVEQRGDLVRMQAQFAKSAAGVYAAALEKLHDAVVGLCDFDANESAAPDDERWARSLDDLAGLARRIFDEVELQFDEEAGHA